MHLGSIFASFTKYIYYLTKGVLGIFGPFGYPYHSLVAIFSTLQLIFRDKYIISKRICFGQKERIVLANLKSTDKRSVRVFQNLENLAFGVMTSASCRKRNLHLIAIHGMSRVAVGNRNRVSTVVGNKSILSVAFPLKYTGHNLSTAIQLKMSIFSFYQEVFFEHFIYYINAKHLQWVRSEIQASENLL